MTRLDQVRGKDFTKAQFTILSMLLWRVAGVVATVLSFNTMALEVVLVVIVLQCLGNHLVAEPVQKVSSLRPRGPLTL